MNESKLEEKKQLGFTKEILDYLKKNPSVAIAVVSAAITIMSILSSYAGRLANITFLKYWGIDSSYAGLEKENVLYRVVNSAIWIAVIWSISILLQNVFIRIYHDSISYHYAKNEIKNLVKMHKQGLEELKKTEKAFWSDKSATEADYARWLIIKAHKMHLENQSTELNQLQKIVHGDIRGFQKRVLVYLIVAEVVLFLAMWLSTLSSNLSTILTTFIGSASILIIISLLSFHVTKNQRDTLKKQPADDSEKDFSERAEAIRKLEREQYELNYLIYKPQLKDFIFNLLVATIMILLSMPIEGYFNARLSQTFLIVTENEKSEAILFHGGDTYILEEAKIDENTIVIDTSKQRILKTDDISFEKKDRIEGALSREYIKMFSKQMNVVMDEEFLNQAVKEAKLSPGFKKILGTAKTLKKAGNDSLDNLLETVLELEENISHPHYSNIIVEEPELNLFPETQKDLIYDLLEMINSGRDHLLMTTHSPYLLYALNNCMLGALVQENIPEEEEGLQKMKDSFVKPEDVSVWEIKNGKFFPYKENPNYTIQDERGLIRNNYFDRIMKNIMTDFAALMDYCDED